MPSRTVSMTATTRLVDGDLVVQRDDPLRPLVLRIQDVAAPECVVDRDQAARGQPGKNSLVVGILTRLVRVDEDEVELALELLDRLDRRAEVKCDLGTVRAAVEISLRDLGVLRRDLERVDAAVLGQRSRHRERRVAGERADLEDPLGTGRVDEQLEEAALDRPGEHLRRAHRRDRLLANSARSASCGVVCSLGVLLDPFVDEEAHRSTREPPMIASRPSAKRTIALPLPS